MSYPTRWHRQVRFALAAAVVMFGFVCLAPLQGENAPAKKAPAPAAAEFQKAERLMKQVFADDFNRHATKDRLALGRKLLEGGTAAADDPIGRFVLWSTARDLAAGSGDFSTAMAAIDALDSAYQIDATAMRFSVVAAIEQSTRSNPSADVAQKCLNLGYPMLANGDYAGTAKVAALAENMAQRANDSSTVSAAHELATLAHRVSVAADTLARNPQERDAAGTMGAYLCFVRTDWPRGLPLLARGSDPVLADLASQELKAPTKADDIFELANDWWDAAQKLQALYKNGAETHCCELYRKAIPGLKTLARAMAEKRSALHPPIDAAASAAGSSAPAAVHVAAEPVVHEKLPSFTNSLGMIFVKIPLDPNGFDMGSPAEEPGHRPDETRHHVKLTRPYMMGTTPVTTGQFAVFAQAMGYVTEWEREAAANRSTWRNNTTFALSDAHPVSYVTWDDAVEFCKWLSQKEQKNYRLPTEAEWEYADHGGTRTVFFWGDNRADARGHLNCADLSFRKQFPTWSTEEFDDGYTYTSPVATFKPNGYGLYDMAGNIEQWCNDFAGEYRVEEVQDPQGRPQGNAREAHVCRGGSFAAPLDRCRVATRGSYPRHKTGLNWGFRVVLDPNPAPVAAAPAAAPPEVAPPAAAPAPATAAGPAAPPRHKGVNLFDPDPEPAPVQAPPANKPPPPGAAD